MDNRSRSRARRYDDEPKLNVKKVFGVIIAIAVIIMIVISIINIVKSSSKKIEIKNNTYYTAYENGKYGVINNEGEVVIEPEYDEMIIIPDNSRAMFICVYDIDDEAGTYKTKVINDKKEEIITGYDTIEAIDNIDSKQNIWYEDNVLRVSRNGKYGIIDFEGKEVLPIEYDEITALKAATNNFIVKKDNKVGLVNEKGQAIIETEYKDILTLKDGYKSEYIVVDDNDKYGIVSTTGTALIEPAYEDIKYLGSSNLFAVKQDDTWKLIDTDENKILIESGYSDIVEAKSENIIVVKDGKYGVVTKENEEKIKPEYEDLKYAFSIYYIAKKDGKYGIINLENEVVKDFEYQNMIYFENGGFIQADKTDTQTDILDSNLGQKASGIVSEVNEDKGYIKIYTNNEYKYYNFKLEEKNSSDLLTQNTLFLSQKDGKYGYVDKSGNVVVDYIYDDGAEQNSNGFSAVKKDGVWGSINKGGVLACEPSVNLDDSIYIDFIGEWHLDDSGLFYTK